MTHPVVAALQDPAAVAELAELSVAFLLEQPLGRFVDLDRVLDQVDRALDERLTEVRITEHVRPFIDREIARGKSRGDTVGDWLTAEAKAELRSLAGRPIELNRRTVERMVKQDDVREMIRQVVRDTLQRFIETVKTGGDGGGSAVGSVGRKAFGFANRASRGVLGSIGGQIEARLTSAMNGFVANNLDGVLDKVVSVACSPDTSRQMARQGMRLFDQGMKIESKKVAAHAETLPWDDLLEGVPGLIAHNLARPEIRAGIHEEIAAALAIEGERPVRSLWLEEALPAVRADAVAVLTPMITEFGAFAPYVAWLSTHAK